jgi:hypothetical protein
MTETKKTGGFVATLSIGKGNGGIPVDEFCKLVDVVTGRHGKGVMISVQDEHGHMHLTNPEIGEVTGYRYSHHLGYIDIKTGSLVWDGAI